MNCKPGDLAIVVGSTLEGGRYNGTLVHVLYAAPNHHFRLPDGQMNDPGKPGDWVLKTLSGPIKVQIGLRGSRLAIYGTGNDAVLRPLPVFQKRAKSQRPHPHEHSPDY
jgi:hypothetical protein